MAQHGPRRSLAVVLMLGVFGHGVFGIVRRMLMRVHLMVPVRGRRLRLSVLMHMLGGRRLELMHEERRGVAERQRNAGRQHAKQIEQGDKPPRFDAHPPRQANEHGGNLMPAA
jgi:hypothetical protein